LSSSHGGCSSARTLARTVCGARVDRRRSLATWFLNTSRCGFSGCWPTRSRAESALRNVGRRDASTSEPDASRDDGRYDPDRLLGMVTPQTRRHQRRSQRDVRLARGRQAPKNDSGQEATRTATSTARTNQCPAATPGNCANRNTHTATAEAAKATAPATPQPKHASTGPAFVDQDATA
jgi:hypothetical protein